MGNGHPFAGTARDGGGTAPETSSEESLETATYSCLGGPAVQGGCLNGSPSPSGIGQGGSTARVQAGARLPVGATPQGPRGPLTRCWGARGHPGCRHPEASRIIQPSQSGCHLGQKMQPWLALRGRAGPASVDASGRQGPGSPALLNLVAGRWDLCEGGGQASRCRDPAALLPGSLGDPGASFGGRGNPTLSTVHHPRPSHPNHLGQIQGSGVYDREPWPTAPIAGGRPSALGRCLSGTGQSDWGTFASPLS